MAITVHTTMATWLVEFATEGELGSDPGWAARQVWENIQSGQAMRGQVWLGCHNAHYPAPSAPRNTEAKATSPSSPPS